jgi:hypothetical protein
MRTIVLLVLAIALFAPSAEAQTRLTCESQKNQPQYCSADTRGGVRLARQLSDAPCREGATWGYDYRGIWVDRGCRAEFEIGRGGEEPRGAVWGSNEPQRVTCSSEQNQPNFCAVDTRGGVRLVRQISDAPCRESDTWGYDRRGIWVERGCRAEFEVRGGWGQGSPEILTCSSQEYRRQVCPADTRGGVRLVRQISDTDCRQGSTWGFDSRGVWVDRGCRAEFEVGSGGWGWERGPWSQGGETQLVTCESRERRRQVCPVTIAGTVRLVRQLSDAACTERQSWGYDQRGIWVDRGCRGEFEVTSRETRGRRGRNDRSRLSGPMRACADEVIHHLAEASYRNLELEDATQGGAGTSLIEWRVNNYTGYCRVSRNNRVIEFKQD